MTERFVAFWQKHLSFLDVHYHVSPDVFKRRYGVVAAGRQYKSLGGGVVLKSHLGDSVATAEVARELDLPVFGSLVLNAVAGGPSWRSIEASLCKLQAGYTGRLLVHLPTFTGSGHKSRLSRAHSNDMSRRAALAACRVSDETGALKQNVIELLHMARDYPIVLSTGHANRDEVMLLIEAAIKIRVGRMMLNQPANPMTNLTASDLLTFGDLDWLYIEQTALTYLLGYQDWDDFSTVLRLAPNVVYSSDLGQLDQPEISDWLTLSQSWFDRINPPLERRKSVCLDNPLAMLAP